MVVELRLLATAIDGMLPFWRELLQVEQRKVRLPTDLSRWWFQAL